MGSADQSRQRLTLRTEPSLRRVIVVSQSPRKRPEPDV